MQAALVSVSGDAFVAMPNSGVSDGGTPAANGDYFYQPGPGFCSYNVRGKTEHQAHPAPRSIFVAAAAGTINVSVLADGED